MDENGGNMNENELKLLLDEDDSVQKEKLSSLYRRFTDQFMNSLEHLGAI